MVYLNPMNKYCTKHFIFKNQFLWSLYMYMGGYPNIFRIFKNV